MIGEKEKKKRNSIFRRGEKNNTEGRGRGEENSSEGRGEGGRPILLFLGRERFINKNEKKGGGKEESDSIFFQNGGGGGGFFLSSRKREVAHHEVGKRESFGKGGRQSPYHFFGEGR